MNYSFLKDIVGSPWQIDVQTLNGLFPILKGMINGLHIEKGEEPKNHLSYRILTDTRARNGLSGPRAKGTLSPGAAFSTVTEDPNSSISGETNVKVINVLPLRGVLTKHDQDCGPMGTRTLGNRLLKADAESNVIGHIMVVESGGGQAIAVPELTDAMIKCTKPIVVWVDGIAASAAYYVACYAKEIIASRNQDLIGCVGTMLIWEGRKSKSVENKDGDIQVTIYSDGSEDKNSEYEAAINEFNFKPAKDKILNPLNAKFKKDVKSRRSAVTDDQLKGKTYFASEVVGTLIDSIGNFDYALERILSLATALADNKLKGNQSTAKVIPKTPAIKSTVATGRTVGQNKKADPDDVDWETINNLPHNKHVDFNY